MSALDIESARSALLNGVIAYPTEAVFGLGCDPRNEEAILQDFNFERPSRGQRTYSYRR